MKFRKNLELFIENWPAKVLSLAIAIVLAQFYKGSLLERKYLSVPLVIENSGDLVPGVILPKTVKVSVWGEADGIASLREDDLIAYLDFSVFNAEGDYQVPVQTRKRSGASDAESLEISVEPKEFGIKLEKSLSKRVNVKLSLKGAPFEGYEIYETGVDPASVEITGPASVVSKIDEIFTNNIRMESRKTGFSGYIDILRTNSLVSVSGTGKIAYSVKIRETAGARTFTNIAVYFENLDEDLEIVSEVPTGSFTVKGAQSYISAWIPPAAALKASCAGITKPGVYTLPVQSAIPARLELTELLPKTVQVEIKLKEGAR